MKDLYKLLNIEGNFSTAYHPQTDGQTERINQEIEQYLRIYINHHQNDWAEWLPIAEFSYNNKVQSSTGQSPFPTLYGYHPNMGTNLRRETRNKSAQQFETRIQESRKEAEASLKMAAERMKHHYDKKRQESPNYKVGDLVLLNMQNICMTRQMKKLDNLRDGPLKTVKIIGKSAYKLQLPESWKKAGIHPVFDETLLVPYHPPSFPSQQAPTLPPPEVVDDHIEYEVERILDAGMRQGKVQFLVKWKGYTDLHNEWVPQENCTNAQEEINDFYVRFPKKPKTNQVHTEIPLTMELCSLMRPMLTPHTEAIDDNLPSELQLNQLAYKLHRGRCDPKRGLMSRLHSP